MTIRSTALDSLRHDLARGRPEAPRVESLHALAGRVGRPLDVAVARFDGIGDWVLTIPLVTALEASVDVRSVTLAAPRAVTGLLARHIGAAVQQVDLNTTFAPRTRSRRLGKLLAVSGPAQRAAVLDGARSAGRFDLVVLPRWQVDRGYNARAWGLGTRAVLAGHDPAAQPLAGEKERREGRLLAVRPLDTRPVVHEIERLQALMSALGLPTGIDGGYGRDFFAVADEEPDARHVVIHTGASEAKRVWPADRWRETVRLLLDDPDTRVTLIGAPDERAGHEALLRGLGDRAVTIAGGAPFAELPQTIAGASVLLGSDSGPAHIASALGTPSVVLTCHPAGGDPAHANSPERFGPWGNRSVVLRPAPASPECSTRCASDAAHCILGIRPEDVAAAAALLVPGATRA